MSSISSFRFFSDNPIVTGSATAFTYNAVTPPSVKPITLDQLKGYLIIDLSDTSQDELLNLIICIVTECAEKLTKRQFINTQFETFRDLIAFRSSEIELRRSKLVSVVSIDYENEEGMATNIPTTVFGNTFETDYSRIFLKPDQCWPTDVANIPQAIIIKFDAGYGTSSTDVPSALRGALLQHAANFYANRGDCSCDGAGAELALPAQSKKIYQQYRIQDISVSHRIS